jgi:hypothetical protein
LCCVEGSSSGYSAEYCVVLNVRAVGTVQHVMLC